HFNPGDIIGPQSYMVAVRDAVAFQAVYGTNALIAGEFDGSFDRNGESISLIKEAVTTNEVDVVVDRVKYEIVPPWSSAPGRTNSGVALQLIDAAQDNARVSNWDDGSGWRFVSFTGQPSTTSPILYLYLDAFTNEVFLDDIRIVMGNIPAVGSNYLRNGDFETPLVSPWAFLGSTGGNLSVVTNLYSKAGTNCLRLIFNAAGSTSKCLSQQLTLLTTTNYTVSFWYKPTTNALNLTARLGGSSFSQVQNVRPVNATPGAVNWVAGAVNPYPLIWLNEVQPNNPDGFQDNTGTSQPWIELFNSSSNSLNLDGCTLSKAYNNLAQWSFPTGTVIQPGEFRVVFVDGRPQYTTPSNIHASFRMDTTNGAIIFSRNGQLLDYINYTNMLPGVSKGSYPDGQLFDRQLFYHLTPGLGNNPSPVAVSINEWLASNTHTGIDPSTGTYEDWFELYNFGLSDVNLSGFYLTDDTVNPKKWRVPDGTVIAPHTFLFCWADGDLAGTNLTGNALHTSFKLAKGGGELALYTPDSIKVDKVSFSSQSSDVSQGKFPDGNSDGPNYFMPNTTPRTNNVVTNNLFAPILTAIPNFVVNEGSLLTFTNRATDNDVPPQTPAYSLVGTVPDGAAVDPVTGVFTWTPSELQGGAAYSITVQSTDNGGPPMFDTKSFLVTVNEVNSRPALGFLPDRTIDPGTLLSFSITATDSDDPPQAISFGLVSGLSGMTVDPSGLFTWTPTAAQASTTNLVRVSVSDNGTPSLSATQSFVVAVTPGNPCGGYKGDVTGTNGQVTIADWVLVGRFAAGILDPTNPCQTAKADCAKFLGSPCGNGAISIGDWVQAGRYAAGLDPWVLMSDCPPVGAGFAPAGGGFSPASVLRTVTLTNTAVEQGGTNCVRVVMDAAEDEHAVAFSLSYDTNRLVLVSVRLGADAAEANLMTNLLVRGRLGMLISLPESEEAVIFPPGRVVLAELCFRGMSVTNPISSSLRFGDQPIFREVTDALAGTLAATYRDATSVITKGSNFLFEAIKMPAPNSVQLRLVGETGARWSLQVSTDLHDWQPLTTVTNTTGLVEFIDSSAISPPQRFYRAVKF
ncbi:MAG: large repetitive protein, partial [Verrucomicrobiota bacterium]